MCIGRLVAITLPCPPQLLPHNNALPARPLLRLPGDCCGTACEARCVCVARCVRGGVWGEVCGPRSDLQKQRLVERHAEGAWKLKPFGLMMNEPKPHPHPHSSAAPLLSQGPATSAYCGQHSTLAQHASTARYLSILWSVGHASTAH